MKLHPSSEVPPIEIKGNSYSTRYEWVEPGLARMERFHRWRENPVAIIDVIGRYWGLAYTDFQEDLVSFGRKGGRVPVSGRKCVFIPPYSIFESHIAGGNRQMHWVAFVSLGDVPPGLPPRPIVFDAPSERYPESMKEVLAIIRGARNPVEISKEEQPSAVAYKVKSFLDQHCMEDFSIHDIAQKLRFSHAVMDRAFKACFGISPVAYRVRLRVLNAAFLMALGGRKVFDAAMDVGFSSMDHFTRQFRRFVSARPVDYLVSQKPSELLGLKNGRMER